MKIGIDISQLQYQGTGVATYTLNLVKHLLDLADSDQLLLFGGSLRNYRLLQQLAQQLNTTKRLLPLPPSILDFLFNRHALPIEFLTGGVDVFHASDWTQPSSRRAALVTTVHDLTPLKYPEHQHQQIIQTHQRRLGRIEQEQAWVIADSHATKKDLVKMLRWDDSRIVVVPLAAAEAFSQFAQLDRRTKTQRIAEVKAKYQLGQYALSVGTQEPRKNRDRVIEAFNQLELQFPQLQLALVGKYGWGKKTATDQAKPLIKTLGFVPQIDLPALYAGAKVFVYPSLYEGFGLPVLESMTVGTPVVTSNKGSLAEVAGNAAAIVSPHNVGSIATGMIEALTNPQDYRAKGYKQSARFSWHRTAKLTLGVYHAAAQARGK